MNVASGWRGRWLQASMLVAAVGFILLAFFANIYADFPIDLVITRWMQTFHPAWLVTLMVLVSWPGYIPQAMAIVTILVSFLYFTGFRWEAFSSLGAAIGEAGMDEAIKLLVHRPRPSTTLVHVMHVLTSYSFPSGHVMFYFVFFGFLMFLACWRLSPSKLRNGMLMLLGSLVSLVGVSRIYLGEHWTSDVLGAYLLGSLCLITVIRIYLRRRSGQPIQ
jgi:membrane-associated phospholipid phosphatase